MKKLILVFVLCSLILSGCTGVKDAISHVFESFKTDNNAQIQMQEETSDSIQETNTDTTAEHTEAATEVPKDVYPLESKIIVVDAGHGINSYNKQEAVAPGSSEKKAAFATGTRGKDQTEEELNLEVAKKLEKKLTELGATVHMTRKEHNSDMSNIDRAVYANNLNADISIKIHADGSENTSVNGVMMLIPSQKYVSADVYRESKRAGTLIFDGVLKTTGGYNRGVIERSDLTGFNWSKVPIVLLEMGLMTNPQEDALLETDEYQQKIVDGIAEGVIKYFE